MKKLMLKAEAAFKNGDLVTAEALLRQATASSQNSTIASWLLLGTVLEQQGQFAEAILAFERAEQRIGNPHDKARILNKISDILCLKPDSSAEDSDKATRLLEKSIELSPGEASKKIRKNLCAIYFAHEKHALLMPHAEVLLKDPANSSRARLWLAAAYYHFDQKSAGLKHLRDAQLVSHDLDANDIIWLLNLLIDYDCFDEAQLVIDQTGNQKVNISSLQMLKARIYHGQKAHDAVLALLTDEFCNSVNDDTESGRLYSMRAKSLEAIGNYQAAHENFTRMNQRTASGYHVTDAVNTVEKYQGLDHIALTRYPVPDSRPYLPIFMVAFPRSGTTLLDTILDTQKQIATISEMGAVRAAVWKLHQLGKSYPNDLENLSRSDVGSLRDAYYKKNHAYLPADRTFTKLIDKLPLNILHIPLILTLFPDAKIILSLRHPVDVCLSCFQQNFLLNDEMYHFVEIEKCFQRYRDVMALFERFRAELNPNIHIVRYEELVANLDEAAGAVFRFIGIEPDETYRNFHLRNQEKLIATPSRSQVTQPLYKSSRNRWKNYTPQLEPYIPIVQPFIELYGYETAK
jgi:tetratricopeptide (TPR) repeat protein